MAADAAGRPHLPRCLAARCTAAALIDAQRPAALITIGAEDRRTAAAYRDDGWYRIPLAAIIGRGTKPR